VTPRGEVEGVSRDRGDDGGDDPVYGLHRGGALRHSLVRQVAEVFQEQLRARKFAISTLSAGPETNGKNMTWFSKEKPSGLRDRTTVLLEMIEPGHRLVETFCAKGTWSLQDLSRFLGLLRKMLQGTVAFADVRVATQMLFCVSADDPAVVLTLERHHAFRRLCELLTREGMNLFVPDAFRRSEFADNYLRALFPRLSLVVLPFHLLAASGCFGVLSGERNHFSKERIVTVVALLDRVFNEQRVIRMQLRQTFCETHSMCLVS